MGKGTKRPRASESTATPDQTLVPDRTANTASGSNASASAAGRATTAGSTSEGGRQGGKGGEQRQGGKGKQKSVTAVEEWDPLVAKAVVLTWTHADKEAVDEEAGEQAVNNGDGTALMKWLLAPLPPGRFVTKVFERTPLLIQRSAVSPDYYTPWFSCDEIRRMLRENNLKYMYNVDVVRYRKGNRQTVNSNLDGTTERAQEPDVWHRYTEWCSEEKCSVRVLHPQRFSDAVWRLLSVFESFWTSAVGCNAYLTPPHSQGFAPHWDDIDAFILQVEGRKKWKVYAPRTVEEALPRVSSKDFTDAELGAPVLEVELGPGDLLYMPRGFIHQARCARDEHSLHLTISANQANTFADLLEIAIPGALAIACEDHHAFRQSLPPDYVSFMGVMHSDKKLPQRERFVGRVDELVKRVVAALPLDAAADQMAARYLRSRLPLFDSTAVGSGAGAGSDAADEDNPREQLEASDRVQLVAKDAARLVIEEGEAVLYHIMDNDRYAHMGAEDDDGNPVDEEAADAAAREEGRGVMLFDLETAELLEQLVQAWPTPLSLDRWSAQQLHTAQALYDKGILKTL